MHRRRFLTSSVAATLAALAGCATGDTGETTTEAPPATATATESAPATTTGSPTEGGVQSVAGVDLPVPREKFSRGAAEDAIPAIVDPVFAEDWSGIEIEVQNRFTGETSTKEPRLTPEDRVIGIERDGEVRAYPLRILNWHEVTNDDFGGPLLVTFCPLCGSGVTATRRVDGEETRFGVSGLLWNSDLVMYDEKTGSLWSQIAATAVRGPKTGTRLDLVPSTITTWAAWQESHPETTVLRPPPESGTVASGDGIRDYTVNPYAAYDGTSQVGIGDNDFSDDRLHPKARVLGIAADGEAVAYPLEAIQRRGGVVNDAVGGVPVVVAVGPEEQTLHGYVRRVDGETLTFESGSAGEITAGGSTWSVTSGEALDGPEKGTKLEPATDTGQLFWFAWAEFNPETTVFGEKRSE